MTCCSIPRQNRRDETSGIGCLQHRRVNCMNKSPVDDLAFCVLPEHNTSVIIIINLPYFILNSINQKMLEMCVALLLYFIKCCVRAFVCPSMSIRAEYYLITEMKYKLKPLILCLFFRAYGYCTCARENINSTQRTPKQNG